MVLTKAIASRTGLCILIVALTSPGQALMVKERSALLGNNQLDWSSLGKVLNPFSPNLATFLPSSFSAKSTRAEGKRACIVKGLESGSETPHTTRKPILSLTRSGLQG